MPLTYHPITATYLNESASGKAGLFEIEDWDGEMVKHWIPFSVIEDEGRGLVCEVETELNVAEWWLEDREIEY